MDHGKPDKITLEKLEKSYRKALEIQEESFEKTNCLQCFPKKPAVCF